MITYAALCHAVADVFRNVEGIKRVEAFDEMQEGISVYPMLHIIPESIEVDDANEKTDRASFDGSVKVTKLVVSLEGYARPRSHLAADIKDQVALLDTIDGVLCEQTRLLYGLESIHAHRWTAETGVLTYGKTTCSGVIFKLTLTVY
jgi:hypothetical protein